ITHELLEESGYELSQLKLLQPRQRMKPPPDVILHPMPIYQITHQFNETHLHTDGAYAFLTSQAPKHQISDDESGEIKLFTRAELAELPADQTLESVREAALFVFDVCLSEWERVDPAEFN